LGSIPFFPFPPFFPTDGTGRTLLSCLSLSSPDHHSWRKGKQKKKKTHFIRHWKKKEACHAFPRPKMLYYVTHALQKHHPGLSSKLLFHGFLFGAKRFAQ